MKKILMLILLSGCNNYSITYPDFKEGDCLTNGKYGRYGQFVIEKINDRRFFGMQYNIYDGESDYLYGASENFTISSHQVVKCPYFTRISKNDVPFLKSLGLLDKTINLINRDRTLNVISID